MRQTVDSWRRKAPFAVTQAPEVLRADVADEPSVAAEPDPGDRSRVLVVAPEPFYSDRGTPIAVFQLLEALSQLGYQVDLLTYPLGREMAIAGVRVVRGGNPLGLSRVPVGFSFRKLLLDASLFFMMRKMIAHRRYLCIHAVEEAAFAAVLLAGRQTKVVYDMQSSMPEQMAKHRFFRLAPINRLLRACERWLLHRADYVVSSAGLGERVRSYAPNARLREWYYASPAAPPAEAEVAALRRSLHLPSEAQVVLYTGTFEAYQGLRQLVDAVPLVLAQVPRAVFILVGASGDDDLSFDPETDELMQRGILRIIERQPRTEVARYLAMADVLVSPRAYGANLPLKIFDYLAAGRPIVATDIPTHRALLSEERGARLVPPTAPALAEAIARLLRDPTESEALGVAGRRWAEAHLGWLAFVESVSQVYAEVSGGDRGQPRGY